FLQKNFSSVRLAKAFTVKPILPDETFGLPWENQLVKLEKLPPIVPKAPIFQPGNESIFACMASTLFCMAAIESFLAAFSDFNSSTDCADSMAVTKPKAIISKLFFIIISYLSFQNSLKRPT